MDDFGRTKPLKWTVGLSVFNGLIGAIGALFAFAHSLPGNGITALTFTTAWFAGAWGLFTLRAWGWWVLLLTSFAGLFMDVVINQRLRLDTSSIVLLILLLASSVREIAAPETDSIDSGAEAVEP